MEMINAVVAPAGFEPAISALRGLRPRPLDDGATQHQDRVNGFRSFVLYPRLRLGNRAAPTSASVKRSQTGRLR